MSNGDYAEDFGEKFQQHVLAVAARSPSFILRYRSVLNHEYFSADLHRLVAKALFAHVDQFQIVPTQTTLLEDVKVLTDDDTLDHVSRLLEKLYADDISDSNAVIHKIIEFGKTQAMCNAVIQCAEKIEKGKRGDIIEIIRDASVVGEDLSNIGINYADTIEDRAAWYLNPDENLDVIPTGITHLDLAMGGGLGRGELGVVLAPPKKGKTTTIINIGFGALLSPCKYNVFHYTLEMSQNKVSRRYDDRLAGSLVKVKKSDPQLYAEELKSRMNKFIRGRLFIKEFKTRAATVSNFRSHLSLLASQGFYPDLILVDYADIAKPERRLGEMRHEQAGIYEDLRSLAGEYDAALWTGSQAKVSAMEKDTITIADFAESFEKAAIVDAAVAFCQTQDESVERKCRLFMAALRNGEGGTTVECSIARDRCLIKSVQLLDGSMTPVSAADDDDDKPGSNTAERVQAAGKMSTGTLANKLKTDAGIKKPPQKKGAFKKGPFKKGRTERISKKVAP